MSPRKHSRQLQQSYLQDYGAPPALENGDCTFLHLMEATLSSLSVDTVAPIAGAFPEPESGLASSLFFQQWPRMQLYSTTYRTGPQTSPLSLRRTRLYNIRLWPLLVKAAQKLNTLPLLKAIGYLKAKSALPVAYLIKTLYQPASLLSLCAYQL